MMSISICVPVYNTAPYLPQCLDSLLSQTLQEIEILLVDDGSTDESGKICDEYSQQDSRIRVFHKPNGGSASARQVAWDNMTGEYCIVCDSDDWVEPTMYEEMYKKAKEEDADMVICDVFFNYPNGKEVRRKRTKINCNRDALLRDLLMQRIGGSTWNKLVRTDIYRRYNLSWELGINLGEDTFIFLKQLQFPIKVVSYPKPLYHYRRRYGESTYTNQLTLASFEQAEYVLDWKLTHIDTNLYGRELFSSTLDCAFVALRVKNMSKEYYRCFMDKYLPCQKFVSYRLFTKKYFLILFSKIFGLFAAKTICSILYRSVYK